MAKKKLKDCSWKDEKYYHHAKKGSEDVKHPGMMLLKKLVGKADSVLDLGCGEGTRLIVLTKGKKKGVGVDISKVAIDMAKKTAPKLNFIRADLEQLPFEDESFDLVYSAYVLEHLDKPERVIDEGIRVTKPGGNLVFIAPNYGAPNRASPPFAGSRIQKFIGGVVTDFVWFSKKGAQLNWSKVVPTTKTREYKSDIDTTVEPYLGSLIKFIRKRGLVVRKAVSCWGEELAGAKPHQKLFRVLGVCGVYPFWMWGPHLVVIAKKVAGNAR